MRHFSELLQIAIERHGSLAAVEGQIPAIASQDKLIARPGDRWLSEMTRHIFNAGFNRKTIRAKWPDFEAAFYGFDPHACAAMSETWFDQLLGDKRIIRNALRIRAVQRNAVFLLKETEKHGNFGAFLSSWPATSFAELLRYLQANGDRLGDKTAQYFLREAGVESYVLSFDVVKRLALEGVADGLPTSHKQRLAIQSAFDIWLAQSGKSLTYVSRVLAMSVESVRPSRFK